MTFSSLKDKPGKPLVQRQYRNIFYSGALNALTLYWLEGGCRESPEELIHIIESLYRTTFWEE